MVLIVVFSGLDYFNSLIMILIETIILYVLAWLFKKVLMCCLCYVGLSSGC